MKKKVYEKPMLTTEEFVPQSYVASCLGTNTWLIKCNVPYGFGYIDTNDNGKFDEESETKIASGDGCGIYHTVELPANEAPKANAMWQPTTGIILERPDGPSFAVFYWKESVSGKSDHHFSVASKGEWHKNVS